MGWFNWFKKKESLASGLIIEGTSSLQCICPVCDYGDGYVSNVVPVAASPHTVKCSTCKTTFLSIGINETGGE